MPPPSPTDLVTFESGSLGAKMNRTLYQETAALYNRRARQAAGAAASWLPFVH